MKNFQVKVSETFGSFCALQEKEKKKFSLPSGRGGRSYFFHEGSKRAFSPQQNFKLVYK
jgi:hypothetical protein